MLATTFGVCHLVPTPEGVGCPAPEKHRGPGGCDGYIRLRPQDVPRLPDPTSNLAGLSGDANTFPTLSHLPFTERLNHVLKTSSPTGTRNAESQEWQRALPGPSLHDRETFGATQSKLPPRASASSTTNRLGLSQLASPRLSFCICIMGMVSPVPLPREVPRTPRGIRFGRTGVGQRE